MKKQEPVRVTVKEKYPLDMFTGFQSYIAGIAKLENATRGLHTPDPWWRKYGGKYARK